MIRQKYEDSKIELQGLLSRKKQVDQNLVKNFKKKAGYCSLFSLKVKEI
jgi:flagellar biosynthesis chaperone FliJ